MKNIRHSLIKYYIIIINCHWLVIIIDKITDMELKNTLHYHIYRS